MTINKTLIEQLKKCTIRFDYPGELSPLLDRAKNAIYVLLGESSHGTSEFYTIRAQLSKRLIEDHHFLFIEVEGDWPSCFEVNRYIKGNALEYQNAHDVLKKAFNRWPTWMWANEDMVDFIEWLYRYNHSHPENMIGFYGLDVYSLWSPWKPLLTI